MTCLGLNIITGLVLFKGKAIGLMPIIQNA
jgi:hypothetical protein